MMSVGEAGACSIAGCDRRLRDRLSGLCNAHWQRQYRHGDPLGGRTDYGEPIRHLLEDVLPYAGRECMIWPFARDGHGYARMRINGKAKLVTRIVCSVENGPPPTVDHQAAHTCGNGTGGCVSRSHLRWKTQSENEADKYVHGTRRKKS